MAKRKRTKTISKTMHRLLKMKH